jgi:hypothetical protein
MPVAFTACPSIAAAAALAAALSVVLPAEAQLREVRPARTAFAFGWSDVTGYGTAVALLERLPRAPLALGLAAGGGGVGLHVQVLFPNYLSWGPPPPDHERVIYLSAGATRLFRRHHPGEAQLEWAALMGSELWPDGRPGLFMDVGIGVVGTIGGTTPSRHLGGPTIRMLMGWAF